MLKNYHLFTILLRVARGHLGIDAWVEAEMSRFEIPDFIG